MQSYTGLRSQSFCAKSGQLKLKDIYLIFLGDKLSSVRVL